MSKRENGFYWIRWYPDGKSSDGEVDIAYWNDPAFEDTNREPHWTLTGSDVPLRDHEFNLVVLSDDPLEPPHDAR